MNHLPDNCSLDAINNAAGIDHTDFLSHIDSLRDEIRSYNRELTNSDHLEQIRHAAHATITLVEQILDACDMEELQ